MRVLITGATGLVGKEITRLCFGKNIKVSYLTTSQKKIGNSSGYTGFYWNPATGEIDLNCFNGVDAIINLAGASISKRWTSNYKKRILNSRVDSLKLIDESLMKIDHQVKTLVTASGINIYPSSLAHYYEEDEKAIDESFLGKTVLAWEKAADEIKKHNISVSKIRIGLVLANSGGALPQMVKPVKYYMGAVFGLGEQWQSWIHIKDLAEMFLFVVENELEGVYNAVAPNPVTNCKLIKEIASVIKKPLVLPNIPQSLMKLMLGEMSYLLFASQRVASRKIEGEGFSFEFSNISTALEDLLRQKGQFQEEFA